MEDWHRYGEKLAAMENFVKVHVKNERNRKLIFDFEKDIVAREISKPRIIRYLVSLKKIDEWLGKDFDKATKDDIISLLSEIEKQPLSVWTKHGYKVIIKRFYKWLFQCEDTYPDIVRWIKANVKKKLQKLPNEGEMLSENEVQRLIDSALNLRDKAFVSLLWETGCRVGELATLRIRSLTFDEYGILLSVYGKTGARNVRVINSNSYLASWLNIHPFRENRESPLWINIGQRDYGKQWEWAAIRKMLKMLFKKANVQKKSNPHSFRHARATYLASHLTEFQMNSYFGWVQGSNMPSTYVHLSSRDIDGALLKLSGIQTNQAKQEIHIQPRKCSRCSFINAYEHKYCSKCGSVIDIAESLKVQEEARIIEKKRQFSDEIMNKLFSDPEMQEFIKTRLVALQTSNS